MHLMKLVVYFKLANIINVLKRKEKCLKNVPYIITNDAYIIINILLFSIFTCYTLDDEQLPSL